MHHIFKLSVLFTLMFVIPATFIQGKATPNNFFDKASFYAAMAGSSAEDVNIILAILKESSIPEKTAYEGALLMKKAGLLTKAKDKISFFRSGRTKLETAIKNDDGNIEYHFLRLIIQENSPNIAKYKKDLKTDAQLVRTSFKKLSPVIQQAVKEYSKKSNILNPADF
ncbi:MAG: hypothetical protein H7Z13_07605 [Ferruginibacter sp.]|nr:hypothetical protein [Ferruginibacter sp.]